MQQIEAAESSVTIVKANDTPGRHVQKQPVLAPPLSDRILPVFAVVSLAVLLAAAVRWALDHPFGVHWDEAQYFNDVQIDVHRLRSGMLLKFVGRIMVKSWGIPPAFRILADPLLAVVGFSTFAARLISLAGFVLSCGFVFLAVKRIASQSAAAVAALIFGLSPEVVSASIFFGTDTSLYLATSAMLYCLITIWTEKSESSRKWVGLGLALGLGFLAKTSFIVIAIPVLLFWFAAARWGKWDLPNPAAQWKAALLALILAGPWWVINAKAAFAYGHYARSFVRNSLGTPSLATGVRWLNTVVQCLLGHGTAILILLVLIAFLVITVVRKKQVLGSLQKASLGACACAGLPIVGAQLSGTNHLLRHISPAMIPLAIAAGIILESSGWLRSRGLITVSCLLLSLQLGMLVAPVVVPNNSQVDLGFVNGALPWRTMARFDQWDWKPVMELSDYCGVTNPKIAYLGNGRAFNKPEIAFPWVERSASARGVLLDVPDPNWLWRYENGPIDWPSVMDAASHSDVVITAPGFVGEPNYKENLDNQYNAEFAARLSHNARFRAAIPVTMGRFAPIDVSIFMSNKLACPAGASGGSAKELVQ